MKLTQQKKSRACPLIAVPKLSTDGSHYCWNGLAVKYDNLKGYGVYATKKLPAGLMLPYGGVPISQRKAMSHLKSASRTYADPTKRYTKADYLLDTYQDYGKFLDAHPSNYNNHIIRQLCGGIGGGGKIQEEEEEEEEHHENNTKQLPDYGWIASLVNEPSQREIANAQLVVLDSNDPLLNLEEFKKKYNSYPTIEHQIPAFVVLVCDLEPNEEITCVYRYSARAHKRLNYIHGQDVDESTEDFRNRCIKSLPGTTTTTTKLTTTTRRKPHRSVKQQKVTRANLRKLNRRKGSC